MSPLQQQSIPFVFDVNIISVEIAVYLLQDDECVKC